MTHSSLAPATLPASATDIYHVVASGPGGLLQLLALLVPGMILLVIFDLRVPGERRKYNDSLLLVVLFSAMFDLVAYAITIAVPRLPPLLLISSVFFALPAVVGWISVDIREWLSYRGLVLSSTPSAWDDLFRRLGRSKTLYALKITLSDGRIVGGIYDSDGFVSTYPVEGDLLIARPAQVDQRSGRFLTLIPSTYGLYVKRNDIIAMEVLDLESAFAERDTSEQGPRSADDPAHETTGG